MTDLEISNPPAFPSSNIIERNAKGHLIGHEISGAGLTMRDYFAAKAMQMKFGESNRSLSLEQMAKVCYEMADAMLAARGGDK